MMPSAGSKKRANPECGGDDGEPSSRVPTVMFTQEMRLQAGPGTVTEVRQACVFATPAALLVCGMWYGWCVGCVC